MYDLFPLPLDPFHHVYLCLAGTKRHLGQQRRGKLCLALQKLQGLISPHHHLFNLSNLSFSLHYYAFSSSNLHVSFSVQKEHTANILSSPKAYPQADTPKKQNIIEIDCRGLEFVDFKPDGEWKAVGAESGTKFDAIDLTEGDWYDYDEKASDEVSIKDLKWEIKRA